MIPPQDCNKHAELIALNTSPNLCKYQLRIDRWSWYQETIKFISPICDYGNIGEVDFYKTNEKM